MQLQCPICKAPVEPGAKSMPFCSRRCQQIDLSRWLVEGYSFPVPLRSGDEEEEDEGPSPEAFRDADEE